MAKKSKSKYVLLAKAKYPFGGLINQGATGLAKMLGANENTAQLIGSGVATATGLIPGMQDNLMQGADLIGDIGTATKDKNLQKVGQVTKPIAGLAANMMPNGGTVPIYYARGTKDDTGKINTSYYQTNMPYKKGQKINPYATATNMGSNPQIITPDVYQNALKQFPNQIGYGPVTGDLNTTFENRLTPQAAQPIKPGMQQSFPNGGTIKEDDVNYNAQLEKQEVFQEPDGTTEQVEAPSHQNGGINLNLEQGTRVYSDRLKSKNGITFAKEAEAFKTNKFEKTLEDNKADQLKKKTAQLMLEKNKRALDRIFEEQEAQKDDNFANDVFAFGGTMMYKDGGIHIKPENRGKFTAAAKRAGKSVQEYASQILAHKENYSSTLVKRANFARNASKFKHADGGHIELNRLPTYFADGGTKQAFLDRAMQAQTKVAYYVEGGKFNPLLSGSEDIMAPQAPGTYSTPSTNWNGFGTSNVKIPGSGKFSTPEMGNTFNPETSGEFNGFNWGKLGTEAAIGIAQNFGPASFLAGKDNKADVQAFYNYNPNTLDPTNALRDVDQSTSALRSAIPGTTGGSGNLAINALLANKLQGDQTKANVRAEYDRANAGIRNQGDQFNIGNRYRTDDLNQANRDKVLSARYKAKYDIGENLARQGSSITRENKANQYDQASLDMIPSMFSYFEQHPEAMKQFKAFRTKRR